MAFWRAHSPLRPPQDLRGYILEERWGLPDSAAHTGGGRCGHSLWTVTEGLCSKALSQVPEGEQNILSRISFKGCSGGNMPTPPRGIESCRMGAWVFHRLHRLTFLVVSDTLLPGQYRTGRQPRWTGTPVSSPLPT